MIFKCTTCGYLYDETKVGVKFVDLSDSWACSECSAQKSLFIPADDTIAGSKKDDVATIVPVEEDSAMIRQMATTGQTVSAPGGDRRKPSLWDDVFIMAAGLARKPLEDSVDVNTKTVIGRHARQPMGLDTPIMISHMSLGALSHNSKIALAKASKAVGTSIGSGEGGVLSAELSHAHKYILEYVPDQYSATDANLQRADAIEIKISQAARPGIGSHLPGNKVTAEVAELRGVKRGIAVSSSASFSSINEPWDLLLLVNELRERSGGRPIGIKLAANNIEEDLKWVEHAKPDFITIDGHGGGTNSSPVVVKESVSVPTLYALYRARKFIDGSNLKIDIIITGGLRSSADFAKALALGANAVAIATATLIAMTSQGDLPPEEKVANYISTSNEELKMFARIVGREDIHALNVEDLTTTNSEVSAYTNIRHA